MAKINGTYVSLHEKSDDYPYYKGNLEFDANLCLADFFEKTGGFDKPDTYQFKGVPFTDIEKSNPKKSDMEEFFSGKFPYKTLLLTESNSAHHLTYFYVKEILKKLPPDQTEGKLLVVNFDQHEDTGSGLGAFYCGSWGGNSICNAAGCDYLIVGKDTGTARLCTGEGTGTSVSADSLTNIYNNYNKIYVTVDMDVLTCGEDLKRTNWGSGNMTLNELKERLAEIPAGKLICADITGFPPVDSGKLENFHALFDSYINDICETAEILCGLMGIPPYID